VHFCLHCLIYKVHRLACEALVFDLRRRWEIEQVQFSGAVVLLARRLSRSDAGKIELSSDFLLRLGRFVLVLFRRFRFFRRTFILPYLDLDCQLLFLRFCFFIASFETQKTRPINLPHSPHLCQHLFFVFLNYFFSGYFCVFLVLST